jgi:hypothetical protein
MGGTGSGLPELLTFFVITIVIFLICRELVCWYWKQNEMVKLNKNQIELLEEVRDLLKEANLKRPNPKYIKRKPPTKKINATPEDKLKKMSGAKITLADQ